VAHAEDAAGAVGQLKAHRLRARLVDLLRERVQRGHVTQSRRSRD
jgi:hypothetical protein